MKAVIIAAAVLLGLASASANAEWVNGYTKKDGTYVSGYNRSSKNSIKSDNYSSQSMGGSERDEYSTTPSTNKSNSSWSYSDNDGDGISNQYDSEPNKKSQW